MMIIKMENSIMSVYSDLKFESVKRLFYYIDSTLMDEEIYADDYTMCGSSIRVILEDGKSFLIDEVNVDEINDNGVTYIICK